KLPSSASESESYSNSCNKGSTTTTCSLPSTAVAKFADFMKKTDNEKLHGLLARAVYSSNAPLSITENRHWQEFFKVLRPSFKLPNRKQLGGALLSLKLPVKTRWGSILHCLESLYEAKYILQALVVTEEVQNNLINIDRNIKKYILDEEIFWVQVQKVKEILIPIVKHFTLLESDMPYLSLVIQAFKELHLVFNNLVLHLPIAKKEKENMFTILNKRKTMWINNIHYATNILDPKFRGRDLTNDEYLSGVEFIENFLKNESSISAEDVTSTVKEISDYMCSKGSYSKNFLWNAVNNVDSLTWWQGYCLKTNLAKPGIAILSMPPTSAATERSFSSYSLVHTAKRNRLTVEKAGLLTYVHHNLKLLSDNENEKNNNIYSCTLLEGEGDHKNETERTKPKKTEKVAGSSTATPLSTVRRNNSSYTNKAVSADIDIDELLDDEEEDESIHDQSSESSDNGIMDLESDWHSANERSVSHSQNGPTVVSDTPKATPTPKRKTLSSPSSSLTNAKKIHLSKISSRFTERKNFKDKADNKILLKKLRILNIEEKIKLKELEMKEVEAQYQKQKNEMEHQYIKSRHALQLKVLEEQLRS
ncbi:hypothetical protein NQ315_014727, partial [Exocentrus adspersus]